MPTGGCPLARGRCRDSADRQGGVNTGDRRYRGGGFGDTPEAVAKSISEIVHAGAVGVNLEDGTPRGAAPIRTIADAAQRIAAAREAARTAAVPIVINALTDLYLRNIGDPATRFDEAVERGKAYLAAGADCFYPIGLRDTAAIGRLVEALGAPININVRAGSPSVAELEALGVARASTASAVALMAASAIRQIAEELKSSGRFDVSGVWAAPFSVVDAA